MFRRALLIFVTQDQLEELRMKMGATLSERYTSTQKGTAKMMTDYEKMRKDLMKVPNSHCTKYLDFIPLLIDMQLRLMGKKLIDNQNLLYSLSVSMSYSFNFLALL